MGYMAKLRVCRGAFVQARSGETLGPVQSSPLRTVLSGIRCPGANAELAPRERLTVCSRRPELKGTVVRRGRDRRAPGVGPRYAEVLATPCLVREMPRTSPFFVVSDDVTNT